MAAVFRCVAGCDNPAETLVKSLVPSEVSVKKGVVVSAFLEIVWAKNNCASTINTAERYFVIIEEWILVLVFIQRMVAPPVFFVTGSNKKNNRESFENRHLKIKPPPRIPEHHNKEIAIQQNNGQGVIPFCRQFLVAVDFRFNIGNYVFWNQT